MDSFDKRIIYELQKDSKQTVKELASKVGLSPTPVHERVKKLERNGTISSYVALVKPVAVGLNLLAFCNVTLTQHRKEYLIRFEEEVILFKEVVECFHTAGNFDYILKIHVRDMEAYQSFIVNELADFEFIGKVESSFVMTTVKASTELPIE